MISVVQAHNTLNKQYNIDGTKTSGVNLSNFNIRSFPVETPHELAELFKKLAHNEIIISGTSEQQTLPTAKRIHFNLPDAPWFPFDRDYLVKDQPTIALLQQLDPQFKYVSHLRKSSASNIYRNDKLQATHREKIWIRFAPGTTHEMIKTYVTKLQHKAFILGLARLALSPNMDSFQEVTESIFDSSVFRPEALHYEGVPVINDPTVKHNTYYEPHTGEQQYIHTDKLHFSTLDETRYKRKHQQAKAELKPHKMKRKEQVKRQRPSQDWESLDRGFISDDVVLHTIDKEEVKIGQLLTWLMQEQNITPYLDKEYTDPMDPSYHDGTQKAKLYLNEDNSLILHSFAHGSHHYRAAANITLLPECLEDLGCKVTSTPKDPISLEEKRKTLNTIVRILPYFYVRSQIEADFAAQTINKVASKSIIGNLIKEHSFNPHNQVTIEDHPLKEFVFFKEGGGKCITLDPEEGMITMSIAGAKELLANKHQELSGSELYDQWIQHPDRKDVTSFGLYPDNTPNKLSMWADFVSYELGKDVTEHDILPFIYHIKLATGDDPEGFTYFMNWLADMVQNPLRSGARPAIILHSEAQGTGKGTLFSLIASFFQDYNVFESPKLDSLVGKHNKHLMSTVFFGLDEVVATAEYQQGQITDILKNITTEDRLTVEPKMIDAKQVPNRIHLMVMTNKEFRFLDSLNRRFTVFSFSDKHKQDVPYRNKLMDWWTKEDGMNLTFTYLKQLKVNNEMAQSNLKNEATTKSSVNQLFGPGGRYKWLFYFLADLRGDTKMNSMEIYNSYLGAYETYKGSRVGASEQRDITSFLKKEFTSPALETKSNMYLIRRDIMREKFSLKFLNGTNFKWEDYENVTEEELNIDKEVEL